jgi:carbamate kinase
MKSQFAEGSMGAKVKAACQFVERGGEFAAIGSIDDVPALLAGTAGTTVMRGPADLAAVTGAAITKEAD